jgi:hypothetical protein
LIYCLSVGGAVLAITTEKKKDTVVCLAGCAVVSVFGSGGKLAVFLLWREIFITTEKKKRYSCLSGGCVINYDRKKKIQSSVCWVRGSGDYDQKKKDTVVSGNFHYDRKKKIHYDRKKKIQSSLAGN